MAFDPAISAAPYAGVDPASQPPDPRSIRLLDQLDAVERLLPRALEAGEEAVHKLRVALRRTGVVARELEAAGGREGGRLRELRAEVTRLFRALGGLRDLDILEREWRSLLEEGRLPGPPAPQVREWIGLERRRLRVGLPSAAAAYLEAVQRFRAQGGACLRFQTPVSADEGRAGMAHRARKFLRQLEKAREGATDEALHRLRIRGKQLRYASEAAGPSASRSLESHLKGLQDALGALQDAVGAVARIEALAAGGTLPAAVAAPLRAAAAAERDRRRRKFVEELEAGVYEDLLIEVNEVAAKPGDGRSGEAQGEREESAERLPLERIPGIGSAKARRLEEAGLATPEAIRAASVEDLSAVKTIGPHQARLIKEYVEGGASTNGPSEAAPAEEPDGKRFERVQSVLAVGAAVADYARTLAQELSLQDAGDAERAARQAERLAEGLQDLGPRLEPISTKRLKGLRGELRETEGLLAKVLDLDASSLKLNKLRKALKAHRRAIASYLA